MRNIIFSILCMSAIFVQSNFVTDSSIVPKWLIALLIISVIVGYYSFKILFGSFVEFNFLLIGIGIATVCFLQALYGLLQYLNLLFSYSSCKIVGSFDNPAGFAACLCIGLPFVRFLISKYNNKYMLLGGWVVAFVIVIAVVLSCSRAGIISISVICIVLLFRKQDLKYIYKYLLLCSLVLLLIGCYWMKKDSADGRLLIWQCTINMVKDSPWIGHGLGSFEACYMDYQAEYFKICGQKNHYAMLADNVKHPFNEYMGVLLNFGIIGLLILLLIISLLLYCYKRNPTIEKTVAIYALTSVGTLSLFSYPFTYPFTWIVTFLSILIIIREYVKEFLIVSWKKNIVCVLLFGCSMVGIYKLVERIQAELEWGRISKQAFSSSYNEVLPVYEKLEKIFEDNPYFLYNYAAVLLEKKQYNKSLEIALQCRKYWADYDLELVIGENYQQLNKPKLAEKYYNSASMMCPSRFLPLYKLFHLYKTNGEKERSLAMAEAVINKPMKINTVTIRMIKSEMEREIQKMNMSINVE